ncbi:MAG TPA: hypothetical protein VM656_06465, partial [Pyrinomonadaceae bacterium]|nr:hypothetical protein [Pyrinomonadaceae bacterium]
MGNTPSAFLSHFGEPSAAKLVWLRPQRGLFWVHLMSAARKASEHKATKELLVANKLGIHA